MAKAAPVLCYAVIIGLLIALALAIFDATQYRRLHAIALVQVSLLEQNATQARNVADDLLKSCRLLSIHRDGRLNVFTFARGDQIFTVETMGLLADNPDEWRRLAGLTQ